MPNPTLSRHSRALGVLTTLSLASLVLPGCKDKATDATAQAQAPASAAAPASAKPAPAPAPAAAAAKLVVPSGLAVDFMEFGPRYGRPAVTDAAALPRELPPPSAERRPPRVRIRLANGRDAWTQEASATRVEP